MRVLNELDRFNLAKAAIMQQPKYAEKSDAFIQQMDRMIAKHNRFIREEGADLPEVTEWEWKNLK
jgi:xylulose-5-phosphate/fructose-6-phosphate phosphoketolase